MHTRLGAALSLLGAMVLLGASGCTEYNFGRMGEPAAGAETPPQGTGDAAPPADSGGADTPEDESE